MYVHLHTFLQIKIYLKSTCLKNIMNSIITLKLWSIYIQSSIIWTISQLVYEKLSKITTITIQQKNKDFATSFAYSTYLDLFLGSSRHLGVMTRSIWECLLFKCLSMLPVLLQYFISSLQCLQTTISSVSSLTKCSQTHDVCLPGITWTSMCLT